MQEQIPESARQVLDVLAEKLGLAGVDLWQAMIEKSALDAVWYWWEAIFFAAACLLTVFGSTILVGFAVRDADDDLCAMGMVGFGVAIVFACIGASLYYWFYLAQDNPTYWALQEILSMARIK